MAMTEEPASKGDILLEEPFRVLFPVGAVGTLLGIVPWMSFALRWSEPPSSYSHGMLKIQCFEASFATGFLMTALPRFLETTPTRSWELFVSLCLALAVGFSLAVDSFHVGQWFYLALMGHVALFGLRRLRTRGDDPPPFFAFIPAGLIAALLGVATILSPIDGFTRLGENLVQQGVLLCFVLAIGSHLGPAYSMVTVDSQRRRHPPPIDGDDSCCSWRACCYRHSSSKRACDSWVPCTSASSVGSA